MNEEAQQTRKPYEIAFGKHKGKTLDELTLKEIRGQVWFLKKTVSEDLKGISHPAHAFLMQVARQFGYVLTDVAIAMKATAPSKADEPSKQGIEPTVPF